MNHQPPTIRNIRDPNSNMTIEKDWFRPEATNYFFGEFYKEGDNSHEGYLPDSKLNLANRTNREIEGLGR